MSLQLKIEMGSNGLLSRGCSHIARMQLIRIIARLIVVQSSMLTIGLTIYLLDQFRPILVEVRFKNTRKGYYRNVNGLSLKIGDIVAVEASPGHDIGIVSLTGELVQ